MATETFNFCPNSLVPATMPRDPVSMISMNGWQFTARPTTPYQRTFSVKLYGLQWFTQANGLFDTTSSPTLNARLLEQFYERNETWNPFNWTHPHLGAMLVRFKTPLTVPVGEVNSGGKIKGPVEATFIHHNPGYS